MKLKSIIGASLLVGLAGPAGAQVMLQKVVIASGGGVSSSAVNRSNITIGQAAAGNVSNATTKGQIGFWTAANTSAGVAEAIPGMDLAIQAWPNPASRICQITVTSSTTRDLDVRLFDLNGRELKVGTAGLTTGKPIQLDVSDLPNGSYILAARTPGQLVEKRISVIR